MRVMVFVKATEASERGDFPEPATSEMMAAMERYNDELREAGILLLAEGLERSASGKRIAFAGEKCMVTDGPFQPADELVAGFWLWEVTDVDEAVAWVKRCPNPMAGPSVIEIRPIGES